jgi:ribonuclease P/MRP protein subunit POP5
MVRVRNRYLLCAIEYANNSEATVAQLAPRALHAAIRASVEYNFGDVGAGCALPSLAVKFWSPHLSLAIVRAHRDHYQVVWAAATLVTALPAANTSNPVRISVVHVGATIRACQKSAVEYAERLIVAKRTAMLPVDRVRAAMQSAQQELSAMETG